MFWRCLFYDPNCKAWRICASCWRAAIRKLQNQTKSPIAVDNEVRP